MVNSLFKYVNGDRVIWMIVIILSLFSIVVAYSASSNMAYRLTDGDATSFLFKHMMLLIAGFTIMIVIHKIKFSLFSRASQLGVYIAAILLLVTLMFGVSKGNASRWIMGFQPSDFAKLVLLIYVARFLAQNKPKIETFKGLLPALIPIGVICGLILPADFSTAALLFVSCLVLLFIGGAKLKHLALVVGGCIVAFGLLLLINVAIPGMLPRADTWNERVVDFFTGSAEENYQSTQAQMGIVNGGVINFQPGGGSIKNDIFSAQSDFVYSTIVEEFGVLIGGLGLLLLYLILFFRCLRLSARAKNKFGAYVAFGLSFILVLQAMINMGVGSTLLPVTGQPLPLVSMGGTSILFSCISIGIILSISHSIEKTEGGKHA
ncbi:MAG TPA: cell division protein FtsW [Flavobacteriales bacterium]|nr:cell division protein FtsW [Crocinitomicaceae bacterium]HAE32068.1 cell division protein FtsW [Flavobacteriales bacterium]